METDSPSGRPMKRPTDMALWIYHNWPIKSLVVDYVQVGASEGETRVTLGGSREKVDGVFWGSIEPMVEVGVNYNSILRLHPHIARQVSEWIRLSEEEAADLAEYERLKKKFG